ncbi:hypothetical protein JCM11491_001211 [Sporobolomyces phaffii]
MLPNSLLPTLLPKPQFRGVVLCGFGVDLFPLVEPPAPSLSSASAQSPGQGQTKALLPVAGRKMIDWVVERAEQAGVFDVLVLTPTSISKPMGHHLRARRSNPASQSSSSHPSAKVDLEEIPEEVASRGTVRVLMWAAEKGLITTDFILLPCDLLLSPNPSPTISLASLLDRHRSDDNLVTTLFSTRASGNVQEARKDGPAEVLTIWDQRSDRLLDVREMDEFDDDEVPIRTSLFNKYPSPTLTTSLLPTQLYIFSSLVLPLLRTNAAQPQTPESQQLLRRLKSFESVKELVGWIARSNWRKGGREDWSAPRRAGTGSGGVDPLSRELAMGRSTTQLPTYAIDHARGAGSSARGGGVGLRSEPQTPGTTTPTPALVSRNSWLDSTSSRSQHPSAGLAGAGGSAGPASHAQSRAGAGGCKIVVWNERDGFCARGNTVAGWVECNRAALKLVPPQPPATSTPSGVFISPDSYLHPTVYGLMGEKVGIKRCIIGKGCQIGKNSKLTNSVIMEGAVIGENVKLDNCVVSNGVQIRDRAVLKDCEFGRDVIVDTDSQLKGEQLTVGDE